MQHAAVSTPHSSSHGTSGAHDPTLLGYCAGRIGDELQYEHGEGAIEGIIFERQGTGIRLLEAESSGPQTMESAAQFVGQAVANGQPDPKGDWLFAIQIRKEPRLIGTIRIGVRSAEHRQGDLGYAVHPDHWGRDLPPSL